MRKVLSIFSLTIAVLFLFAISFINNVSAAPPESIKSEMFLCPSVSPNNPKGQWIIGGSGAYYVNFPGSKSPNWPGLMQGGNALNPFKAVEDNPADVEGQAQTSAGKGLYHRLPSYPYLNTAETGKMAVVLVPDGVEYINGTFGIDLTTYDWGVMMMPMINVMPEAGTAYYDHPMMTLHANVNLAAAAFW